MTSPNNETLKEVAATFTSVSDVVGVYAARTEDGYEITVTYHPTLRLGEILKKLVPLEIELLTKFKNITDFDYVPASDFPDELKASHIVLAERQNTKSGNSTE